MVSGTLFFHKDFKFHDGVDGEKIIVVLGTGSGIALVVKTTSRGTRYLLTYGCQATHRFPNFHLVKNCCCLKKDTWIVLDEFYEFNYNHLLQKHFSNEIHRLGMLSDDITIDLLKCAIHSEDISSSQVEIVRASLKNILSPE